MADRKTRDDWIRAASVALRAAGIDAVKVEALARDLGVTKGSFYWHFEDRNDLLEALLELWEAETEELIEAAASGGTPSDRIVTFFTGAARVGLHPPDLEIFAWARHDPRIAARAARVEGHRMAFLAEQLTASGVPPSEAERRAEIGYLATLGWLERHARRHEEGGDEFGAFAGEVFPLLACFFPISESVVGALGDEGRNES